MSDAAKYAWLRERYAAARATPCASRTEAFASRSASVKLYSFRSANSAALIVVDDARLEEGKTKAPFAFIIPVQKDMTKAAELVNVLRAQGIEVGVASADLKYGDTTYPAGSFVIKRDQPYGRLAKNLLEKQDYPDPRLTTYDDSGWTMGYAFNVDIKAVDDKAVLTAATTPVTTAALKGTFKGTGTAAMAIAHYGSNNMVAFRYATKNVAMKIAEKVDVMMPTRKVKAMSRSWPEPNTNSDMAARNVVVEVMIVRAKTLLMALLMMSRSEPLGFSFSSSRIRSNTTTVSLME